MEALRNQALLYAYYLDQKDRAIELLNQLVSNPRVNATLQAKAKLDLGDIYLLKGEYWESTLLYSQVEKTQKESPVAYDAKLKNAKLSYFKGDFLLAQEHLDILKEATTREIANDALELSLRIKENTAFDTTGAALRVYASIELLLYQNKIDEALKWLQFFMKDSEFWISKEDLYRSDRTLPFENYVKQEGDSVLIKLSLSRATIMDDVYWLEADIRLKRGEFQASLDLLQKIRDEFPDDVLTDDAYFMQGEIHERHLRDKDKAMEIYRDFLNLYPGSVYAAEARKRFRVLRGDFSDVEHQPQF
jgi:tetratricopeptide (TPR) repeat protein